MFTKDVIKSHPGYSQEEYLVCVSPVLIKSIRNMLNMCGIFPKHIHYELFQM